MNGQTINVHAKSAQTILIENTKTLLQNKIPLDKRGNELTLLNFITDEYDLLNDLFDALLINDSFKGSLVVS
jgi:hypothetical protein